MDGFRDEKIENYIYGLPEERIAQFPLKDRSKSKLLVYRNRSASHTTFDKIPDIIPDGSLMVLNNTKVISARIFFRKKSGAKIEVFCLEPAKGKTVEQVFASKQECEWICMVGNAGKWHDEILTKYFADSGSQYVLEAEKTGTDSGNFSIKFRWKPSDITFSEVLNNSGVMPLPPYIKRNAVDNDRKTYQTVYAETEGSVAAPTAGLHFTDDILDGLRKKGIDTLNVTLNVGAGTFKPVKSEKVSGHIMHPEIFTVSIGFLKNFISNDYSHIIPVGTTSVRTLESLYWLGAVKGKLGDGHIKLGQWDPYENNTVKLPSLKESYISIIEHMEKSGKTELRAETSLMIVPGYGYKSADILITNFHLPASSLLLLVAAFIGDDWKNVYNYALKNDFRFLSYGDSSILFKY